MWWLLLGGLTVAGASLWLAWSDDNSGQAFARSAHHVRGIVVERDCAVLCKGGPFVSVAHDHPVEGRVVARLEGPRDVEVGEPVSVVYSDDPNLRGVVVLPPARRGYEASITLELLAGVIALAAAVAAWAFPANLRRLDLRDAQRRSQPGSS